MYLFRREERYWTQLRFSKTSRSFVTNVQEPQLEPVMVGESSVLQGEISALSLNNGVLCGDLKDVTQGSSSLLILLGKLSAHPAGGSCSRCGPDAPRAAPGSSALPVCRPHCSLDVFLSIGRTFFTMY